MNRVIVITGGKGQLGSILTKYLSKNNTVISLSHKDCDVTSVRSINTTIKKIVKNHNRIDVLINAAGVMLYNSVADMTLTELDLSMAINFKGAVCLIKEVLPVMLSQEYGRIINISSIRGLTGAPDKAAYSASKFALQGFSDSLRYDLQDTGVKITNICPGRVLESVACRDIVSSVNYILSLSDRTFIRNIVLGGQL